MGLIDNEIKRAKSLGHTVYKSDYAYINKESGLLRLRKSPYFDNDPGGLIDVEYVIFEGALYVKGKESYWRFIGWGEPLNLKGNLYQISENRFETSIIPEG